VKDENDLVDYKEFVISGKVMILENKDAVKDVLAQSWYNRQKDGIAPGEDSSTTYTWKKHVEWFRKRKSDCLIWLMRRANRAIKYDTYVKTANTYLRHVGKQAIAVSYLLECGLHALGAIQNTKQVIIDMIGRSMHARQWKTKKDESMRFLFEMAKQALKVTNNKSEMISDIREVKSKDHKKHNEYISINGKMVYVKYQIKTGKLYELHFHQRSAYQYLVAKAKHAEQLMKTKDIAYDYLKEIVIKCLKQQEVHIKTQLSLVATGDYAIQYSCVLEKTQLSLIRSGQKAIKHMNRQETALSLLIRNGQKMKYLVERQSKDFEYLSHFGQFNLHHLNSREFAFSHLCERTRKAVYIVEKKKIAFAYLTSIPRRIWAAESRLDDAQLWLMKKGEKAKKHANSCMLAYKYLKVCDCSVFACPIP
jgi:hypothetical protein